jgi:hypothetical protein
LLQHSTTPSLQARTGSVLLEFTMAFPIVLMLILACVQFAHIWLAKLMTHYAAYCAARAALVTVCDESGPTSSNDSWPTREELPHEGFKDSFTRLGSIGLGRDGLAESEAEWAACQAAQEVCAWSVLGAAGVSLKDRKIPNWGRIPASDAVERKVRASIRVQNWNVEATVEQDFALVTPLVGPMIAWGMNPWDPEHPWGERKKDATDDAHRFRDKVGFPHIRIKATVVMPKPYRTDIATGNWKGTPAGAFKSKW